MVATRTKWLRVIFVFVLVFSLTTLTEPVGMADDSEDEDSDTFDLAQLAKLETLQISGNNTGAATYKIPIEVPPGRNGMKPEINLVYNSHFQNGWLGQGWRLDGGSIQRSTKRGVDYDNDRDFVHVKDGYHTELRPRTNEWESGYYGAKIESKFTKYYFNENENRWEVRDKNGTLYIFGSDPESRLENDLGTFKWCLDRVEDTNGNYMEFEYFKSGGEVYLDEIRYTGNGSLSPTNTVKFFSDIRPDIFPSYRTLRNVPADNILKIIKVQAGQQLVRAYKLYYKINEDTKRSILTKVQPFGNDAEIDEIELDVTGTKLPPMNYDWQEYAPGNFLRVYPSVVGSEKLIPGDFDGDGKTDYITGLSGGYGWYVYLSNGNGTFRLAWSPIFPPDWDSPVTGDFDGDGKSDFMINTNTSGYGWYVYLSNGNGTFRYKSSYSCGNPVVGDFDGDGYSDIISNKKSSNNWYVYRSKGDGTFEIISTERSNKRWSGLKLGDFNGDGYTDFFATAWKWIPKRYVHLSNGDGTFRISSELDAKILNSLKVGDFNGDGLSDILEKDWYSGKWTTHLSKGDGVRFDKINSIPNKSNAPLSMGDFNGDGKTDALIFEIQHGWRSVLSNGDGTFRYTYAFSHIDPYYSSAHKVLSGDFDGNGKIDFLINSGLEKTVPNGSTYWMWTGWYTHLSNGVSDPIPDLLLSATNGLGATTTIEYKPSSGYNNTRLPFIVHTVSKITTNDGLNDSEFSYNYKDGLYDSSTREFRGFGWVEKTKPDDTMLETVFSQDEFDRGKVNEVQHKKSDDEGGGLLSKRTLTWENVNLENSDNRSVFVKLISDRTAYYDSETVSKQTDYTCDDSNGNLRSIEASGNDGENVTTTYVPVLKGEWLWRNAEETILNGSDAVVRKTIFDWETGTGNLLAKEYWLGPDADNPRETMTYDAYGNMTTFKDANCNGNSKCNSTTVYEYDAATNTYPVKIINALGHTREYQYDYRYGKVTAEKDENANWTDYYYDVFGRLKQVNSPDEGQKITVYNDYCDDADCLNVIFPRYKISKIKENSSGDFIEKYTYFDGLGREIQKISFGENDKSIVTRRSYDEMGRNYLNEGPYFSTGTCNQSNPTTCYTNNPPSEYFWEETIFDERSRPILVERPDTDDGTIPWRHYEYSGFSKTITDPDGNQKTEKSDYLGRIIEVVEHTDAGPQLTNYNYNAVGNLTQVTNHHGNPTFIEYDALGRKTEMTDPDMGVWSYTYDANGNVKTQTDAKNQTISFTYDDLNRIRYKTYSTADPLVEYIYDNENVLSNGIGRLHYASKGGVVKTIGSYDQMGREKSVTKTIPGAPTSYTTYYGYDLSGKPTAIGYPGQDGYQVNYNYYPGTGLLSSVVGITDMKIFATITGYEPNGKMGRLAHDNNTSTTYSYDSQSLRLTSIQTQKLDGGGLPVNDLQNRQYSYTAAGDIKQIVDDLKGITYTYTYDALHRLTSESSGGAYDPINYSYDAIGNILSKTVGSNTFAYDSYDLPKPHAVKTIHAYGTDYEFIYDDNGNMTSGFDFSDPQQIASRSIEYNAYNMPKKIIHEKGENDVITTFAYDGENVRAKKSVQGGDITYYINENYEVINGQPVKYVFAGNLRIAMVTESFKRYFHKDHLGSSTVVTNEIGGSVESTDYMPFGSTRKHTGMETSNYKFTDQEIDRESGLYNYDARLYDAVIARFISPDPTVPRPFDPQSLNRYSYCINNPLIYIDPSGLNYDVDYGGPDNEGGDKYDNDFDGGIYDTGQGKGLGSDGEGDPNRVNTVELAGIRDPFSIARNLWDLIDYIDQLSKNFAKEQASKLESKIKEIDKDIKEKRDKDFKLDCDPIEDVKDRKVCYNHTQKEYQAQREEKTKDLNNKYNDWMTIVNQR